MHSSLRILQITLIITQITTVKGSSYTTLTTALDLTTSVQAEQSTPVSTVPSMTSDLVDTSVPAKQTTSALPENSVATSSLETPNMSTVYSSSATKTGSPTINVPVTSQTEQLPGAGDVSNSSYVTTGVPSATPSRLWASTSMEGSVSESAMKAGSLTTIVPNTIPTELTTTTTGVPSATPSRLWASTSMEGSVSESAMKAGSLTTIVPNTIPTELTTKTNNTFSVASTKATTLSPSSLLTGQTHSIIANYSLSSASQRGSNSTEPKQTPTTSLPESVNWTDWSVDSSDCQEYCSEKGGTVTASRHCYSHSIMLEKNVCTKHDNSTKVVKCGEKHCPISGKEALGISISTLALSILLVMLSSTFVRD